MAGHDPAYTLAREERIGRRPVQQDRMGHFETEAAMLLLVADGMTGYPRGELAAEIAVGSLAHAFVEEARPRLADPRGFLECALGAAHEAIFRYAALHAIHPCPRSVIVACVIQDRAAWWNHLGDARLYLVRDGTIAAQTRDHTLAQEWVDAGRIDDRAASRIPERNRVLRCLGGPQSPAVEPGASAPLRDGDIVLLCSDGFWAPLKPGRIAGGLAWEALKRSVADLSDDAERRAGVHGDNLTVLAVALRPSMGAGT